MCVCVCMWIIVGIGVCRRARACVWVTVGLDVWRHVCVWIILGVSVCVFVGVGGSGDGRVYLCVREWVWVLVVVYE